MVKMTGSTLPSNRSATLPHGRRDPFHLDDPQYEKERKKQFSQISNTTLTHEGVKEQADRLRREAEKKKWEARQQSFASVDKQELAYNKKLRKEELANVRQRVIDSHEEFSKEEAARIEKTNKDVAVLHAKLEQEYQWAEEDRQHKYEFAGNDLNRWASEARVNSEWDDRKQMQRETEQNAMREAERLKELARLKAEFNLSKRVKGEMAADSKMQVDTETKKLSEKQAEAVAGRKGNIEYANGITRLHWTAPPSPVVLTQYAKDLRDGATVKSLQGKY